MRYAVRVDGHSQRRPVTHAWMALLLMLLASCARDSSAMQPESGAEPPPGAACDPRAPVCRAGQQCTATRWDLSAPWTEPRCADVPAEGAGAVADPCFAVSGELDTCASGLTCTNFGSGEGFCVPRCSEPGSTCPRDTVCAPLDRERGLSLCMLACATDTDCGSPWLSCVAEGSVGYCDSHR